jgi:ATPase subunit of ABC transporter with duplicated ATPase domains
METLLDSFFGPIIAHPRPGRKTGKNTVSKSGEMWYNTLNYDCEDTTMIDIMVKDLVKAFEVDNNILDGLSFEINQGERVGLLGKNGAGKTTLFRVLTEEIGYDTGDVIIAPGKKLGLISQIPHYPADYTVEMVLRSAFSELFSIKKEMERLEAQMAESCPDAVLQQYDKLTNRYTVGGGYDMDTEVDKICNGLNIPAAMRTRLFSMLSGGEKTRVNLARLLLEKTDILLLDEPTNHLDLKSVEWLEDYLLKFKGTVLTISHDRFFLDRVVHRIIELHGGKAEFYNGNYSFYVIEKERRRELQQKQYEQEQAKLDQLGYTLDRMRGWGTNNRKMARRAKALEKRMERIQKTERVTNEKTMKARFGEKEFHGDEVLTIKNLSKSFDGRNLFSDIELLVEGGERIALLGDNGAGKSTLLKILLGEEQPDTGRIRFGPSVKTAYLPQIIKFSHPERSLLDTMLYEKDMTPQSARNRLGSFMFQGEDVFKSVSMLSGGEQSRLRLCMLMDEKINLLILDEPTNHLDIASREWIEAALEDYEGNLLFVSHDRYFIDRFADRIWELEGGTIRDFKGDYEQFRAMKEREAAAAPKVTAPKKEHKEKPKAKVNTKTVEKQIAKLERDISKQEDLLSSLDEQIQAAATDYAELSRLMTEKEQQEAALADLYSQWEEASLQLEQANG